MNFSKLTQLLSLDLFQGLLWAFYQESLFFLGHPVVDRLRQEPNESKGTCSKHFIKDDDGAFIIFFNVLICCFLSQNIWGDSYEDGDLARAAQREGFSLAWRLPQELRLWLWLGAGQIWWGPGGTGGDKTDRYRSLLNPVHRSCSNSLARLLVCSLWPNNFQNHDGDQDGGGAACKQELQKPSLDLRVWDGENQQDLPRDATRIQQPWWHTLLPHHKVHTNIVLTLYLTITCCKRILAILVLNGRKYLLEDEVRKSM